MFSITATPSLGNFIITRERDVGVAAFVLVEAFDVVAQRSLPHHRISPNRGIVNNLFTTPGCGGLAISHILRLSARIWPADVVSASPR